MFPHYFSISIPFQFQSKFAMDTFFCHFAKNRNSNFSVPNSPALAPLVEKFIFLKIMNAQKSYKALEIAQEINGYQKKLQKHVQKKAKNVLLKRDSGDGRKPEQEDILQQIINIKMKKLASEIPYSDPETKSNIMNLL